MDTCEYIQYFTTAVVVSGKVGYPSTGLTTPVGWLSPTDRPKSVRNRCVIEVFGGVFVSSITFWIFVWVYGLLS